MTDVRFRCVVASRAAPALIAHLCDVRLNETVATLLHDSPICGEGRPGLSEQPSKALCRASHPRAADIRPHE